MKKTATFCLVSILCTFSILAEARVVKLTMPEKTFRIITEDGKPLANVGLRASVGAEDIRSSGCGGIPPTSGNPFDFVMGVMDKIGTAFGACRSEIGTIGPAYLESHLQRTYGPLFITDSEGYVTVPQIDFLSEYHKPYIKIGLSSYSFLYRASDGVNYTCFNDGLYWSQAPHRVISLDGQNWGDEVWVGKLEDSKVKKVGNAQYGQFVGILDGRDEVFVPHKQFSNHANDKNGESKINYTSVPISSQILEELVTSRIKDVEEYIRHKPAIKEMGRVGCKVAQ
jgi:hypothetical protein